MSRQRTIEIVTVIAVMAITGVACFQSIRLSLAPTSLYRSVLECMSCDEAAFIRHVGEPEARISGAEYLRSRVQDIERSYRPSPPKVQSDRVLVYTYGVTIVVVFFSNGSPRLVYVGET